MPYLWCRIHRIVHAERVESWAVCRPVGPFPTREAADEFAHTDTRSGLRSPLVYPHKPAQGGGYQQSRCARLSPDGASLRCPTCKMDEHPLARHCSGCEALFIGILHACDHRDRHATSPHNGATWLMAKVVGREPCDTCAEQRPAQAYPRRLRSVYSLDDQMAVDGSEIFPS